LQSGRVRCKLSSSRPRLSSDKPLRLIRRRRGDQTIGSPISNFP